MKRRDFIKSVVTLATLAPIASNKAIADLSEEIDSERKNNMKVLIINGSPRINGNTTVALNEMEKVFKEEGIETETIQIGMKDIRGCLACYKCGETGKCVIDDLVNEVAPKFEQADGLVVGTPVYYSSANGTLLNFLSRLFMSTKFDKTMKVGAGIAAARRGGLTATYDELNKFFGNFWNANSFWPILERNSWNQYW